MKSIKLYTTLCLATSICFTHSLIAESIYFNELDASGLFMSMSGLNNSIKYDQYTYANSLSGLSDINGNWQMFKPANSFYRTPYSISHEGHAGYSGHFTHTNQLWGVKFQYQANQYNQSNSALDDIQLNAKDLSNESTHLKSFQANINHELMLLGYLGHAFAASNIYFGAGPALIGMYSNAFENHYVENVMHPISNNYASNQWLWGGAAQIGTTYYFDPSWFLDFSYTLTATRNYSSTFSGAMQSHFNSYNDMLYAINNQLFTAQAFSISMNKKFLQ